MQDCFECTDWKVFKEAATYDQQTWLKECTDFVTGYTEKSIEDVNVVKTVITCSNQKPWLTAEILSLLRARDAASRSGYGGLFK